MRFYRCLMMQALLFLFLIGCSPTTLNDLRSEAETEIKKLTIELRKMESKEDIQKGSKRLKKRFNRISDLLVKTRGIPRSVQPPLLVGEELFAELARLYEIPGGREVIEATQRGAVRKLDR